MHVLDRESAAFPAAVLTDSLMSSMTRKRLCQRSGTRARASPSRLLPRSKSTTARQQDSRTRHWLLVRLVHSSSRISGRYLSRVLDVSGTRADQMLAIDSCKK